jgi:preprotein translocase subunit SecG
LLTGILFTLFILACIVLVVSVLLQPGKADAGALFTSSVSSTAFGPRGTQTILAKITIGAAAAFMLIALLLGMGVGSQRSLMEGAKAKPTPAATPAQQTAPAQTTASPAAPTQTDNGAAAPAGDTNAPATPAASPESKASPSK